MEHDRLTSVGVNKGQTLAMEMEPIAPRPILTPPHRSLTRTIVTGTILTRTILTRTIITRTIKPIAQNRQPQPPGIRRMNPQLMGTTGQRLEFHPAVALGLPQQPKSGLTSFALAEIHPLPGAIGGTAPQRQINQPFPRIQ